MLPDCDILLSTIREQLHESLRVHPLNGVTCVLRTPFSDQYGDPIDITVTQQTGTFVIEDNGIVAGHLFSLGQHTQDTPSSRLLQALAKAYGLKLDYDQGVVKLTVQSDALYNGVMDLVKVIITMLTATPHLQVRPRRIRRFGARVRRKIMEQYEAREILYWVEPYYEIPGAAVEGWPIDFHWQIAEDDLRKDVYVVAVDLNVMEPLKKVEHIAALAVDAKASVGENHLRIVMDRHGMDSDATVAANFLERHKHELQYSLFDFGVKSDAQQFVERSAAEILGAQGREWRDLWRATRGRIV